MVFFISLLISVALFLTVWSFIFNYINDFDALASEKKFFVLSSYMWSAIVFNLVLPIYLIRPFLQNILV